MGPLLNLSLCRCSSNSTNAAYPRMLKSLTWSWCRHLGASPRLGAGSPCSPPVRLRGTCCSWSRGAVPERWRILVEVPRGFCHYPPRGVDAGHHSCNLQDYRVQEYRLPSPPSFKCNVLRESLSVDSQNIPCTKLKRKGSWINSVYISGRFEPCNPR